MNIKAIRNTTNNKVAGGVRLMLAVIFLMTGTMKLLVPQLAEAWSGQLLAAQIPLYEISRWTVPYGGEQARGVWIGLLVKILAN